MKEIDWEHRQDFEFTYTIGMAGPFTCILSKDIKVTRYKISSVAEATVHDFIEALRKTHGKTVIVEKSEDRDILYAAVYAPEQYIKAHVEILLASLEETAKKPFIGLSPQDRIMVHVTDLAKEGYRVSGVTAAVHEVLLNSETTAELTIDKIHREMPAALDQEFFDKAVGEGSVTSAAELAAHLQQRLIQNAQKNAELLLEDAIQKMLLKQTDIPLPEDFLKKGLQKKNSSMSQEQLASAYENSADHLRWELITAKLMQEHGLQITHQEVVDNTKQALQDALKHVGVSQPIAEERLEALTANFLQENDGEHYRRSYRSIARRKLFDFVKEQITIETHEVSVEDFEKLE
jgi:trigger factor